MLDFTQYGAYVFYRALIENIREFNFRGGARACVNERGRGQKGE